MQSTREGGPVLLRHNCNAQWLDSCRPVHVARYFVAVPAGVARSRSTAAHTPAAGQHRRRATAAAGAERWQRLRSRGTASDAVAATTGVASPGDYCEAEYTVSTEDGNVVDSSREAGAQACFILGSSHVVAGFHQAVGGLAVGESRKHRVSAEDAYGNTLNA